MSAGYTTFHGSYTQIKFSLTSAQILNLQTSPVTILSSPGAGNTYIFDNFIFKLNFNTSAYTSNLNLAIYLGGVGNIHVSTNSNILGQSQSIAGMSAKTAFVGAQNQYVTNQPIVVTVNNAGNPLAGNSTLDIYFGYKILTY